MQRIMSMMAAVVVGSLALVSLSGCGKATDVTLAKPGVYKGQKDPLVAKLRDPKMQEELVARFNQVQTDR